VHASDAIDWVRKGLAIQMSRPIATCGAAVAAMVAHVLFGTFAIAFWPLLYALLVGRLGCRAAVPDTEVDALTLRRLVGLGVLASLPVLLLKLILALVPFGIGGDKGAYLAMAWFTLAAARIGPVLLFFAALVIVPLSSILAVAAVMHAPVLVTWQRLGARRALVMSLQVWRVNWRPSLAVALGVILLVLGFYAALAALAFLNLGILAILVAPIYLFGGILLVGAVGIGAGLAVSSPDALAGALSSHG
jgi:hypothetical protein